MSSGNQKSSQSAQQRAYEFIRRKIIDRSYIGGAKLNPTKIALDLNLSRMPVREALLQLDAEGLVTMRLNRGTIVTTLSVEEVEQLFQMRAALEGVAARRAAKMIKPEQKAELRTIIERMGRMSHTPYAWIKLHDDFHEIVCSIGGWDRLAAEIRKIRGAVHPYLLLYNNVYHETEMRGADHTGLLLAIETGNEILAQTVAADHVLNAGTGVVEWLKQSPNFDHGVESEAGQMGRQSGKAVGKRAKPKPLTQTLS